VATASYEARPFGCHSAMPMARAVRRCPQAVVVPVRMSRYREVSAQIFRLFGEFTPLVEGLSVDEAFLDLTGCEAALGPAPEIARRLKTRIRAETGLTASVGVAPNKFLAKLGSDLEKPDGLLVITEAHKQAVLDPLPIGRIWGVGAATRERFERLGARTVAEARRLPLATLERNFGSAGERFYHLCRGEDDRPVIPEREAKSLSSESTFAHDIADREALRQTLLHQVEDVASRLRRHGLFTRTVTLKVRLLDFTTVTRAASLPTPTQRTDELWRATEGLFGTWARGERRPVRLLGVGFSQLSREGGRQLDLFAPDAGRRQDDLDAAVDDLKQRFGKDALRRGGVQSSEG